MELVEERQLVVKTAVLERVIDQWSLAALRRAQVAHSGVIWLSESGLVLSRVRPLPPALATVGGQRALEPGENL